MRNKDIAHFLARPPDGAYAEAYQILRNREDAREVVAQAVANAWEHAAEYRGDAAIETWFVRIVRNLAVMELRRRAGIARRTPELARWTPQVRTPESLLLADERYRLLRRSVGVLPRQMRTTIECVYWYGMTIDGAAARLGVSSGCCKARAWRALRFLAKRLAGVSPARSPIVRRCEISPLRGRVDIPTTKPPGRQLSSRQSGRRAGIVLTDDSLSPLRGRGDGDAGSTQKYQYCV